MPKENYCVARVEPRTKSEIGNQERHIERKNDNYSNTDVVLTESDRNIHFKQCQGSYIDELEKLIEEGKISTRGLKDNAHLFDELIFDVNTEYFQEHGGYDFAKLFYEGAFRFAEKKMGKDNIISAVMHADEINKAATEKYGYPVYHYHLHIIAIPTVRKEIKWSARCKDEALRGTVKEVINQISHSKKWASERMIAEDGNEYLVKSYSLLQDEFYKYMSELGFDDIIRGKRGSTAQNLNVIEYKIQKDTERLEDIQARIEIAHEVDKGCEDIDKIGKKTITGKIQMDATDYEDLKALAKEGIKSRGLEHYYKGRIERLEKQLAEVKEKLSNTLRLCKDYIEAKRLEPNTLKECISGIFERAKEREQKAEREKARKLMEKYYRKPKKRSDIEWER